MFSWIRDKIKAIITFAKTAVSEQDGLPSTSRITAALVTISTIGWVTYIVIHTGVLPDLTSASMFVAAGHGGYAANKISGMFGKGD